MPHTSAPASRARTAHVCLAMCVVSDAASEKAEGTGLSTYPFSVILLGLRSLNPLSRANRKTCRRLSGLPKGRELFFCEWIAKGSGKKGKLDGMGWRCQNGCPA